MDNVLWVVIVGAVMIAMAGFTLYVGTDIGDIVDDGNDSVTDQRCQFEYDEANREDDCSLMSEECEQALGCPT